MSALSDAVVAELARRYSPQTKRNPAWDRRAERAAWDRDTEYEVPEEIPRTAEEMAGDSCHHVTPNTEGDMAIYTLSYQQIAEVVEAVEQGYELRKRYCQARESGGVTCVLDLGHEGDHSVRTFAEQMAKFGPMGFPE